MFGNSNFFFGKKWRLPWAVWSLFGTELAFTIPALALFAVAQPDQYRTRLRQFGSDHGWNSDPSIDYYRLANHLTLETPPPWSEFTTDYNVIISIVSMFVLLVKVIGFVLHIFWPIFGLITHGTLVGLWGYSVYAQTASDHADPQKPQNGAPWYISKGCGAVTDHDLHGYCQQAQASLAVSVIMLLLFTLNTLLSIWSMVPSQEEKDRRARRREEESELDMEEDNFQYPPPPQSKQARAWEQEMQSLKGPMSPAQPEKAPAATPRTTAFNRLAGSNDLPLRQ